MEIEYRVIPVAEDPTSHMALNSACVVSKCGSYDLEYTVWAVYTGHPSQNIDRRLIGTCCPYHAVALPMGGIREYSFNLNLTGPPEIIPIESRPEGAPDT